MAFGSQCVVYIDEQFHVIKVAVAAVRYELLYLEFGEISLLRLEWTNGISDAAGTAEDSSQS